jgi:hypothetical protein
MRQPCPNTVIAQVSVLAVMCIPMGEQGAALRNTRARRRRPSPWSSMNRARLTFALQLSTQLLAAPTQRLAP